MLKSYGYWIAFGFLVGALVASVFWTALLSPLTPPYSTENQQGTKSANKEAAKVSADDRIADYTEWLAVLTGGLVVVSAVQIGFLIRADKTARISANAANLSAQAAIGVELPRLLVSKVDFPYMSGSGRYKISITITNYGRTPAYLTHETAEMRDGLLPDVPDYANIVNLGPGALIEKDTTRTLFARDINQLSVFDQAQFAENRLVWVYGIINFRDFLDNPHAARFCFRLERQEGPGLSLIPIHYGPKGYTESY
jgi:hypothetical protein